MQALLSSSQMRGTLNCGMRSSYAIAVVSATKSLSIRMRLPDGMLAGAAKEGWSRRYLRFVEHRRWTTTTSLKINAKSAQHGPRSVPSAFELTKTIFLIDQNW